jgi:hypothetical protein
MSQSSSKRAYGRSFSEVHNPLETEGETLPTQGNDEEPVKKKQKKTKKKFEGHKFENIDSQAFKSLLAETP